MQIKCENCSIVYNVSENHLVIRHPKFLKCTSCGHIFKAPAINATIESKENTPPAVEQSDVIPMSLSEIFQTNVQEDIIEENSPVEENFMEEKPLQKEALLPKTSEEENILSFSKKENQTPDLFTPFDATDEFMPVSENNKNKKKFIFVLLFILLLILSVLYLLYVGRYFFVREAGISDKIYQMADIQTNITGEGLAFQDTIFEIVSNLDEYSLIVKSNVVNTTDSIKTLPLIILSLKDEKGNIVQEKLIDLKQTLLKEGNSIPFETQLTPVNENARKIHLTFKKE